MNESITELIKLLQLSEDDVLKAILTVYSPCQPGPLRKNWENRKNYGSPPTAKELWGIYKKYDFRCAICGSQYRISFDHINNDVYDSKLENFQVLCSSCNREKQKRGVKFKNKNLLVYKTLMKMYKETKNLPNSYLVHKTAGVGSNGGASHSLVEFLLHRLKQLSLNNNDNGTISP